MNDVSTDGQIILKSSSESFTQNIPIALSKMHQCNSLTDLHINLDTFVGRSKEEWNAIKRFKMVCMHCPSHERIDAMTGTIDILGKVFYYDKHVGKRMLDYMTRRLHLTNARAIQICNLRNNDTHDHDQEMFDEELFLKVRDLVGSDLGSIFGIRVVKVPYLEIAFFGKKSK